MLFYFLFSVQDLCYLLYAICCCVLFSVECWSPITLSCYIAVKHLTIFRTILFSNFIICRHLFVVGLISASCQIHGRLPEAHAASLLLPLLNRTGKKTGWKSSWVKIKTGRSYTSCHNRLNRLNLRKINFTY